MDYACGSLHLEFGKLVSFLAPIICLAALLAALLAPFVCGLTKECRLDCLPAVLRIGHRRRIGQACL